MTPSINYEVLRLSDLLYGVRQGHFRASDFQRSLWSDGPDRRQIIKLFDSINKRIPIGTLTVWATRAVLETLVDDFDEKGRKLARSQRPRDYRGPRQELGENNQRGRRSCPSCKKRRGTGGDRVWGKLGELWVCHICIKASDPGNSRPPAGVDQV